MAVFFFWEGYELFPGPLSLFLPPGPFFRNPFFSLDLLKIPATCWYSFPSSYVFFDAMSPSRYSPSERHVLATLPVIPLMPIGIFTLLSTAFLFLSPVNSSVSNFSNSSPRHTCLLLSLRHCCYRLFPFPLTEFYFLNTFLLSE